MAPKGASASRRTEARPASKRGRPRLGSKRALSRDRILDKALEIAKRDGLEQLSLRRLADALGVDSASLYWHFSNKQELLAAALERAGSEVMLAEPTEGPWRERCMTFCEELRRVVYVHPEILRLQDQASPLTPFVVDASRILIDVLAQTGLRGEQLVLAAQTLLWQVLGTTRLELGAARARPSAEAVDEVRRLAVPTATAGLDLDEWQAIANAYADLSFTRLFEHSVATALDGIEYQIKQMSSARVRRKRG